ncbi:hypothetical protein [Mycolicibacterium septicum]|uniref:hypothetical protein n=1 Tax=Mycolicibacterium septicum TaxID=98668 RepID=UPI001AF1C75A|nr:hypothetical protein [Mycolicibacterium septicum]QRY51832.1 hypothetical protein JVX95_31410 [Mycolicibacterium septicum]
MKAKEKMARRHDLFNTLLDIDTRISMTATTDGNTVDLLEHRVKVCRAMERVGYRAWGLEDA